MGLFDRFRRVVKSNINDMISKAESPEKMLTQLIEDMNGQLIDSKNAVASVIVDEKQLERQLLQQRTRPEDWEKRAVLAVHEGQDDLAKRALVRKQELDEHVSSYQDQWHSRDTSAFEAFYRMAKKGGPDSKRRRTPNGRSTSSTPATGRSNASSSSSRD